MFSDNVENVLKITSANDKMLNFSIAKGTSKILFRKSLLALRSI